VLISLRLFLGILLQPSSPPNLRVLCQAVLDPFIYVPNGIGGIFAIILCGLCFVFPKSRGSATLSEQELPKGAMEADNGHAYDLDVTMGTRQRQGAINMSKDADSQA
jgi:hypothetical protein